MWFLFVIAVPFSAELSDVALHEMADVICLQEVVEVVVSESFVGP